MGHEIRSTDGFGEVRANGERAWHGLGIEIEPGLTATQAFPKIGLDWSTELLPVFAEQAGGSRIDLPKSRAHVRADTRKVLGLVSDGWQPVENMQLASFADALLGEDAAMTVETAASLRGGERVFALMRLPKTIEVTREDLVNCYMLLSNGHGGTAGFSVYPTSVRVVCANTLRMAEREMHRGVWFTHTGDLDKKLAQAKLALGFAVTEIDRLERQVKALAAWDLTVGQMKDFMQMAFEASFGRIPDRDHNAELHDKLTGKRDNLVSQWLANLDNERQSMAGVRGTAWAAYNAVSEWNDHQRGRFDDVRGSDERVNSNLFGVSHASKSKVFAKAVELAGAK